MNVADRLVFLRKRESMSQQELADKVGLSRSSIAMYEKGERVPPLDVLEAFADVFNVNMDFLIGHEDNEWSERFREMLAHILSQADPEDIIAANIDMSEMEMVIDGNVQLTFDHACSIADALGETLDTMLGRDTDSFNKNIDDLDNQIIGILLTLPEQKKKEALNYLRYLSSKTSP